MGICKWMQLVFRYLGSWATNLFLLTAGVRELRLLAATLWQFDGTGTNCNWLKTMHRLRYFTYLAHSKRLSTCTFMFYWRRIRFLKATPILEQHICDRRPSNVPVATAYLNRMVSRVFSVKLCTFYYYFCRSGKRNCALTVSDLCCYSRGTLLLRPKTSSSGSGSSGVSSVSLKSKRKLGFRLFDPSEV